MAVELIDLNNYSVPDNAPREIALSPKYVTDDNFVCGILTYYAAHQKTAIVSMSSCTAKKVALRATVTQEYDIGIRLLYRP